MNLKTGFYIWFLHFPPALFYRFCWSEGFFPISNLFSKKRFLSWIWLWRLNSMFFHGWKTSKTRWLSHRRCQIYSTVTYSISHQNEWRIHLFLYDVNVRDCFLFYVYSFHFNIGRFTFVVQNVMNDPGWRRCRVRNKSTWNVYDIFSF